MMGALDSYALSDFLLFSSDVYARLFEIYNHSIWPFQIIALMISGFIGYALIRKNISRSRWIFLVVSMFWMWTAFKFHYQQFQSINIAAKYFAALFFVQGVLLMALGFVGNGFRSRHRGVPYKIGLGLFLYAAFVQAIFVLWTERIWSELLLFGWGPDATAVGTLGLILMFKNRIYGWLLFLAPLAWCCVSLLIYYGLQMPEFYEWLPAVLLAVSTKLFIDLRNQNGGIF